MEKNKYYRGSSLASTRKKNVIKSKVRHKKIIQRDQKIEEGLAKATKAEILLSEQAGQIEVEKGEHTLQLKQCDIVKHVDIASATKSFHLDLRQFGPYKISYSLNGRQLLLGGHKGHIAAFDWVTKKLLCEMGVQETVHDVVWLHNENMFAAAQKQWTYMYDNQGIEVHCLKALDRVTSLNFLPYHFLLNAGHESGFISWVDVSIGKIISQYGTYKGSLDIMTVNPSNAVTHCGHANGTVSLWTPNSKKSVASVLCHGTPISAIAIDNVGRLMATGGRDGLLRLWDLRNTFAPLTSVRVGVPSSLNFSQRGLLAVGTGNQTMIFSEVGQKQKPYLKHVTAGFVESAKFCPFEDVLGIGTQRGFDSIIVPGAGEANFDALERNPFQTKKQRKEAEVRSLLEKIPVELISMDNSILGDIDTESLKKARDQQPKYVKKADIQLQHRKKRKNAKIPKIKEGLRTELNLRMAKNAKEDVSEGEEDDQPRRKTPKQSQVISDDPLARFVKKKKK
ncbi:WD repeat-containing protein 46 [Orchesella cincta]|uniref:WD repeat-containing protein 46 n=1 Tax=Orchesella cincta TaxID=48709 RepID=A0A1D2NIJ5_ORCCI|nr:WD repeat-containing protein 46 [Orchesella cincta]